MLAAGLAVLVLDRGFAALIRWSGVPLHQDTSMPLALGVTVLAWRLLKVWRSGRTPVQALRRRKARQRAWWEGLDEDNLRLATAETAAVLCFAVLPALVPVAAVTEGRDTVMRVWPAVVVALVAWWMWQDLGPVVKQAGVVAWGNAGAALAACVAVTVRPSLWPYAMVWGAGGWLLTMPYTVPLRMRLKREGRLKPPK